MPWGTKKQIAKKSSPTIKWGKPYPTRKWAVKAKGKPVFGWTKVKDGKPVSGWTKGKDVSNIKKNTWGQFSFEEQVFSQVSYILIFFSFKANSSQSNFLLVDFL